MIERIAAARRLVIKVGTNVIMRDDGLVSVGRLYTIVESIARICRTDCNVVIVSSGAIGLGVERLRLDANPTALALKQACAAVGQSRLMALYEHAFERLGVVTAQVLLTDDDLADPCRYQNLRATLETLFALGVVPIVNENDTVSTHEIERESITADGTSSRIFSDNDMLSALVASKLDADLLLLLSDVDGLFTANPQRNSDATVIPIVHDITDDIIAAADGSSARGRGGMASKLQAARVATNAGVITIIANGRVPNVIDQVCTGDPIGTVFLPLAFEGVMQ